MKNPHHPLIEDCDSPDTVQQTAARRFSQKMNMIEAAYLEVLPLIEADRYAEAAITLHLVLRELYGIASCFLTGKSCVSNNLYEQQQYISGCAPQLAQLFDPADENEYALLSVLAETFGPDLGNASLTVSATDIRTLDEKAQWLTGEVRALCTAAGDTLHLAFEASDLPQMESVRDIVHGDAVPAEAYAEITAIITKFIKTQHIYCFGHRRSSSVSHSALQPGFSREDEQLHLYLLVVCPEIPYNTVADLSDLIRAKTNGRYTITPLVHKAHHILYSLPRYGHFYYHLLNNGTLVSKDPEAAALVLEECPPRDMDAARKYWKQRKAIAETFFIATGSDDSDEEQCHRAMLQLAVEHTCLGLIEVFLGYRPAHYSLRYLFDLCEHFSIITSDIFPRHTEEEQEMFKLLTTGVGGLRQSAPRDCDTAVMEILNRRCWRLFERGVEEVGCRF